MGIDFVDIMFRIETAFDIRLDTEDFQTPPEPGSKIPRFRTKVGDLYEIVLERRSRDKAPQPSAGLADRALEEVRQALAAVLDIPHEQIGENDSLEELLPQPRRNRLWRTLKKHLRMDLMSLKPRGKWYGPVWLTSFVAMISIAVTMQSVLLWSMLQQDYVIDCLLAILWMIAVISTVIISAILTNALLALPVWFTWEVPKGLQTVGDLAQSVLALNRGRFVELCGSDPDDDAWESLRFIIADALAVDLKQVTKEADLFKDLGAA